jgi:peroxiredoxin
MFLMSFWLVLPLGPQGSLHAQTKVPPPTPQPPREESVTPQPLGETSARVYPGDRAPDFELEGSRGKSVRLSSLRGDWIALVFSDRAAPTVGLQSIERDLRLLGARVVAVVREKPQTVQSLVEREDMTILLLADATGEVSALYGLRDSVHPVVRPSLLILDRKGNVRTTVMGQVLPPAEIVRLMRGAIAEAQPKSTTNAKSLP